MADNSVSVGDAARAALGPVGTYLPIALTETPPIDEQREAARGLERAGYRAAWTNETVGGKDALVQLSVLLAATDRMTFGTGIANIWSRPAQTAQAAAAQLAQAYPTRLVLGLGVGYPQQAEAVGRDFGNPVTTMRDYLEKMSAPTVPPAATGQFPRILAANRPKMLALAAELTDGALPVGLPASATAQVRRALGPDKSRTSPAPSRESGSRSANSADSPTGGTASLVPPHCMKKDDSASPSGASSPWRRRQRRTRPRHRDPGRGRSPSSDRWTIDRSG
jgi:alkanesulfonate monooxygenase SsuD/methylene tetrahydromethanopterin reductase-like flavin-dependent oxidoreductase (luciferase family)